jgi:hypothetical protein
MVTSKQVHGNKILVEYDSSNLKKGEYDTTTHKLQLTFKTDGVYEYDDISHETFAQLNLAESQGKFFNSNIKKNYTFRTVLKS